MLKRFGKENKHKGFTLTELLIVMGIIGILASIAVPQMAAYGQRGYNITAKSDLKNVFSAAQAYFSENPSGTPSLTNLVSYGYSRTPNVVIGGRLWPQDSLAITSYHTSGNTTYTINSTGTISSSSPGPGCSIQPK
jgi:type IV pilus assembly protein PilA